MDGGQCCLRVLRLLAQLTIVSDSTQISAHDRGGAVEVYGLSACSQYPVRGVFYSGVALHDESGQAVTPSWTPNIQPSPSPDCDLAVGFTTSTVSLSHNPPPPPTVTIVGPSTVEQHVACTWESSVSGGTSPFTYVWKRDGQVVSTGSSYSTSDVGTSDFQLDLKVTDADSQNGLDSEFITVQGSGQIICS